MIDINIVKLSSETEGDKTKAIFRCEGDDQTVFAKLHAVRQPRPFGEIGWTLSASHCDESGTALRDDDDTVRIAGAKHQVIITSETPEDVLSRLDEGMQMLAGRIFIAVANERAAGSNTGE